MEVGADAHAEEELLRLTQLVPAEPAGWANLGLLALRRNEMEAAAERLNRAAELAPRDASIQLLLARLASQAGHLEEAMGHLRRAVELDSTNVKAMYGLARELERHGGDGWAESALGWHDRILALRPNNLAVLVDRARVAAGQSDAARLSNSVDRLDALSGAWPAETREQLELLRSTASAGDLTGAASRVAFLRNVLLRVPRYRDDLAAVWTPEDQVGEPLERFVSMPSPSGAPAAADTGLTFAADTLSLAEPTAWAWAGGHAATGDDRAQVWVANGRELRHVADGRTIPFPGGPSARPPSQRGVTAFDLDNDFRTDLALAGAGGLRLFQRDTTGELRDVTARTGLPASILRATYSSVWAADLDLEGDLDLLLGAPSAPPRALRNNGDGTFTIVPTFASLDGLADFAWADLDDDGDPDAAMIDGRGALRVFSNDRGAGFGEVAVPGGADDVIALAAGDVDRDGVFDLVTLHADGLVRRHAMEADGSVTARGALVGEGAGTAQSAAGASWLALADLDNNGALDLIVSRSDGTRVWLQDADGTFRILPGAPDGRVFDIAALNDSGRLDLVGLAADGRPAVWRARGAQPYRWIEIRPRAATAAGDQRINSYGIGGVVELRAGLTYQKTTIAGPRVRFGIGTHPEANLARIVWPNGVPQAEFELAADTVIRTTQRLKGSCPWIFAYDGASMAFVTDFIWRSPLGMRINAQETAGVLMTEDRVKIRGDQLAPRDGAYDIRITAELWETHFFDHISLIVVDHPAGTEIFVDERFAVPPPPLEARTTGPVQPIAAARDHRERDVTADVLALDARYLGGFAMGRYQGVAVDHYVEVELGPEAPRSGPLWLVASGWVRPTDSSINVALSQGDHAPPQGLRLEVPDGRGGWTVAHENLGFPAGKTKTVLIDIQDVFADDAPRRVRLRTNLEVYWDRIGWAVGVPNAETIRQRLDPITAELRYRGYSAVNGGVGSTPEIPVYRRLATVAPMWRDLIGFYTRFGDVRPLLATVDDRYVIMNAGDEIALRFPVPAGPEPGWVRDFVLVGDGWVKDGDYNTVYSTTVTPLPAHEQGDYAALSPRLEDDPVYRRHANDWLEYHTRYVSPARLQNALAPNAAATRSASANR